MFICQHCGRQTEPGEKAHSRVVETRPHVHPHRSYLPRGARSEIIDRGGAGAQIVRAIRVCPTCHVLERVDHHRQRESRATAAAGDARIAGHG